MEKGLGHPAGELEKSAFFSIMAAFPTGVAVVTAMDGNRPRGLATNAFCSVSAEPPLVLVCVDNGSRTLPALLASGAFVVNFLAEGRAELTGVFASKADDKFAGVAWRTGENGMPVLHEDAIAWAECAVEREVEAGDHVIVIGRVLGGRAPAADARPLVYFRRGFAV